MSESQRTHPIEESECIAMIESNYETAEHTPLLHGTHSLNELCDKQTTLMARLENGFWRIERAARNGHEVGAWEAVWRELLSEYERVSDQIAAMSNGYPQQHS